MSTLTPTQCVAQLFTRLSEDQAFSAVQKEDKRQFCRFLYMKAFNPYFNEEETSAPAPINNLWRAVIMHTKLYRELCEILGKPVDYFPEREKQREDLKEITRSQAFISVLKLFPFTQNPDSDSDDDVQEEESSKEKHTATEDQQPETGIVVDESHAEVDVDDFFVDDDFIVGGESQSLLSDPDSDDQFDKIITPSSSASSIKKSSVLREPSISGVTRIEKRKARKARKAEKALKSAQPHRSKTHQFQLIFACGKTVNIPWNPSDHILVLKKEMKYLSGVPVDEQKYILGGEEMENEKTFQQYGITPENFVEITFFLRSQPFHPFF